MTMMMVALMLCNLSMLLTSCSNEDNHGDPGETGDRFLFHIKRL